VCVNNKAGEQKKRAWVVAADMGLGHLRAAWPLRDLATGNIITAGARGVTSEAEYRLWMRVRRAYNMASRSGRIPVLGHLSSNLLHAIERIERFYPRRDLSSPSPHVHFIKHLVLRRGLGDALLKHMQTEPLPLITTFYIPALIADYRGYRGDIYCIICDTDVHRVWVADRPRHSRIRYLVPCETAARRLHMYGVPSSHITLTGFPLPTENLGPADTMPILKHDLLQRMANLDPSGRCFRIHAAHIREVIGPGFKPPDAKPVRITFSIGGAGAQVEIAMALLGSLRERLRRGEMILTLSAGTRRELARQLQNRIEALHLGPVLNQNIFLLYSRERERYFDMFNAAMRKTDVLWTKPSELSFYAGLGIPLVLAPPIGPHEVNNGKWLRTHHVGINQEDPRYADEWIDDLLISGTLAEAAWQGFLHCPKTGTYTILDHIFAPRNHAPETDQ
jgi:hypothetical protein